MLRKVVKKIVVGVLIIVFFIVFVGFVSGGMDLIIGEIYANKFDNPKKALKWFTRAAEKGNIDAQYKLGSIYHNGSGVEQDHKEAFKWFTKAAKKGCEWSQLDLALMCAKGEGVQKNYDEAIYWFRRRQVTGTSGLKNPPSFYDDIIGRGGLGRSHAFLKDDKDRLIWLKACASYGDVEAYFKLGDTYYYGKGVEQDYRKAFEWYNKGAYEDYDKNKKGFGGWLDVDTTNETKCKQLAEFLWRHRAAESSAYHQYWVGLQYYIGQIVSRDYEEAIEWFTKAAMHEKTGAKFYYGSIADARFYLGQIYENGEGVIDDYIEAYKWYLLAGMIPSNDTDFLKAKNSLREKMTQEQIEEAQKRAKAFVEK